MCRHRIDTTIRQKTNRVIADRNEYAVAIENDGRFVDVDFVCTTSPAAGALPAVWKAFTVDNDNV